jgi:hypothetical protein
LFQRETLPPFGHTLKVYLPFRDIVFIISLV